MVTAIVMIKAETNRIPDSKKDLEAGFDAGLD
jgi:hypothetical protein